MLKTNKKGFVLMEAIVVIVVISVSLLTLFRSYNKILSKVNEENKYDLSEHLYKTYYIREYIKDNCASDVKIYDLGNTTSIKSNNYDYYSGSISCNGTSINLTNVFGVFEVKHIYILKNVNGKQTLNNLEYFDAYMIDYIKALDVDDNESLIVVEYSKKSRDINYNTLNIYGDTTISLKETYIASLEW